MMTKKFTLVMYAYIKHNMTFFNISARKYNYTLRLFLVDNVLTFNVYTM